MNKKAFITFSAAFFTIAFIVFILTKRLGIDIDIFIVLVFSLLAAFISSKIYASTIKSLLKHIVLVSQKELQIYNLVYPSSPGMDDVKSVILQLMQKAKEQIQSFYKDMNVIKNMIDKVDIGILVVNRHGKVMYANRCIKDIGALGSDTTDIYFFDMIRSYEVSNLFNEVLSDLKTRQSEISIFAPHEMNFQFTISNIDYCGSEQCFLFTLKEITKLKQIEQIRQDFITNASHELKTPLTSIIGYLEALKDDYNKQFIDIAHKNARRMQRIVDDMLILSKADRGPSDLNMKHIGLSEIINEVKSLLNKELENRHQMLSINVHENADVVYADKEAMFHIFLNLMDNAVKYSRENDRIDVEVEGNDKGVEVIVKDTGIGIPSNELDRIFERFYTVDKTRSRELGGTGLGLSIVKHFVLAHNGRIWVESTLNKGSAFHFTIPGK